MLGRKKKRNPEDEPVVFTQILTGHSAAVSKIRFHDDILFSAAHDAQLRLWEVPSGDPLYTIETHSRTFKIRDGKLFSASAADGHFEITAFDVETMVQSHVFKGHENWVSSFVVADHKLITASADKTIRVWDTSDPNEKKKAGKLSKFFGEDKDSVQYAREKKTFGANLTKLMEDADKEVIEGRCIKILGGHTDVVTAIAAHDQLLISGSADQTVRIWHRKSGREVKMLEGHKNWVFSVRTHENWVFSACRDETVRKWDIETGKCLTTIKLGVVPTAMKIGGELLYVSCGDGRVLAYDLKSCKLKREFKGHRGPIRSFKLDRQRNWMFTAGSDNQIRKWNMKSGKLELLFRGHTQAVNSLVVMDGEAMYSSSDDQTVRLWDVRDPIEKMKEEKKGIETLARWRSSISQATADRTRGASVATSVGRSQSAASHMSPRSPRSREI